MFTTKIERCATNPQKTFGWLPIRDVVQASRSHVGQFGLPDIAANEDGCSLYHVIGRVIRGLLPASQVRSMCVREALKRSST